MRASGGRGTRRWSGMDFRYPQVVHRPYPYLSRRGYSAVAASHPIHFAGRLPGGLGPRGSELLEAAPQLRRGDVERPPHEELDQEVPAGAQDGWKHLEHRRHELARARIVRLPDSGQLGREVREDDIGGLTQMLQHDPPRGRIPDITAHQAQVRRRQRLDGDQVDADHATAGADRLEGHLKPPTRPCAQVDDGVAAPEKPEAGVQLRELVGAAGTVAGGPGAAVVGILPPVAHAAPGGDGRYWEAGS